MKLKIGNKTFEVSDKDLESNPTELTIEFDGILRTGDEETSFIENHKKDARKEGLEIAVKQHREEYGFEGRSIDKLIEAVKIKALADASIEPTEQLKAIKLTLSEKETALQNALSKVGEKDKEFSNYKNQSKLDKKLIASMPKNLSHSKEDMLLIMKSKKNYSFDDNGNPTVLDAQGNVMKNATTADAITIEEDITSFFKDNQNYLKALEGGSGAGDSGSAGSKKSLDKFIEEQRSEGNNPNSEEFNTALASQTKAGLIDMD